MSGEPAQTEPQTDANLEGTIEAVLLACDRPISVSRLANLLGLEAERADSTIERAINTLNEAYEKTGRSFRIERVAGGYRVLTVPAYAEAVAAARGIKSDKALTRAALETLAIVAYRQPVTRARVEAIRGAATGELLRTLMERKLVKITGRAEELGRPMLYGTTPRFLEVFGLSSLKDLPPVGELFPPTEPEAGPDTARSTASSEPLTSSKLASHPEHPQAVTHADP